MVLPFRRVRLEKMTKKSDKNMLIGLDIGTSKVVAIVGEVNEEGEIEIIGLGSHPSNGLKKGVVVNIESTVQSIQHAVEEAELMAGCEINSVYAGIAGSHIRSLNSHGIVAIREREVTSGDLDRVIDAARAVAIPADQRVLHILPQEFIIDDQEGIREPIGMSGVRLEAKVHLVTGAVGAAQNIIKCVRRCGLEVDDIILEQLASSYSVLTDDEKELGVCLVDIGGGTTDIAVFYEGTIRHTCELGLGGHNLTNDLSVGLRTPLAEAERLKEDYGSALSAVIKTNHVVDVPSVGDREPRRVTQKVLVDIIEARMVEILEMVNRELLASGQKNRINAGVVLTGGTSLLVNLVDLAEQIFDLPVRVGYPNGIGGRVDDVYTPRCTTGVGLVLYGRDHQMSAMDQDTGVMDRMRGLFKKIM